MAQERTRSCEVCIPPEYRTACDRYQRGYRRCVADRKHDQAVIAGLQASDRGRKLEGEQLQARIAELEEAEERRWSPLKIGSIGGCVVGAGLTTVGWATDAGLVTRVVTGLTTVGVCVVAVAVD